MEDKLRRYEKIEFLGEGQVRNEQVYGKEVMFLNLSVCNCL